jgi:hypothetical protein
MSTINQNTIRNPGMRLRSATLRQERRRNLPSAIIRQTRVLETRRTILANTIRELEADLRQQHGALDALTIEVDQALTRRDDEGDRYQTLREERDKLRYTILTNFNQSNLGMEYKELKRRWHEYVHNEDENTDINYYNNLKARFDHVSALFDELMDSGLASIIAEKELARETYRLASERHYTLYQGQQYIIGVISDLDKQLKQALNRDRALNQARGKRQRRPTHKKGRNTIKIRL